MRKPILTAYRLPLGGKVPLPLPGKYLAVEYYSEPLSIALDNSHMFPARIGLQLGPEDFRSVTLQNNSASEANHVAIWTSEVPIVFHAAMEPKTFPIPRNDTLAAAGTVSFSGFYDYGGPHLARRRRKELLLTNTDAAGYLTYKEYLLDAQSVPAALISAGLIGPKQTIRLINDHAVTVLNDTGGAIDLYSIAYLYG